MWNNNDSEHITWAGEPGSGVVYLFVFHKIQIPLQSKESVFNSIGCCDSRCFCHGLEHRQKKSIGMGLPQCRDVIWSWVWNCMLFVKLAGLSAVLTMELISCSIEISTQIFKGVGDLYKTNGREKYQHCKALSAAGIWWWEGLVYIEVGKMEKKMLGKRF